MRCLCGVIVCCCVAGCLPEENQAFSGLADVVGGEKPARSAVDLVTVSGASFESPVDSLGLRRPCISLTIHNGTPHAISCVYFEAVLTSPGRTVPWVSSPFQYEIAGGLEPGETQQWDLDPGTFSDWGRVDPPADGVLQLTVKRIDGADGRSLR